MGLFSFIMPLRASNYLYRELKPVIIIGDVNYIEKEWPKLEHFPLIYVFNVSAINYSLCCLETCYTDFEKL